MSKSSNELVATHTALANFRFSGPNEGSLEVLAG